MKQQLERWHATLAAICGEMSVAIIRSRVSKSSLTEWGAALAAVAKETEESAERSTHHRHGNDGTKQSGSGVRTSNRDDVSRERQHDKVGNADQADLPGLDRGASGAPHTGRRISKATNITHDDGKRDAAADKRRKRSRSP